MRYEVILKLGRCLILDAESVLKAAQTVEDMDYDELHERGNLEIQSVEEVTE